MEVWSLGQCAGCGLCVAACSKQVLRWDGEDHPVRTHRAKTVGYTKGELDSCSFCQKFCEEVCPRLERWNAFEPTVTLSAKARGPVKSGAPNDVIRSLLAAGRSAGLLDGVVMLDLDPWELKPVARVAFSVEEIVDSVGPQYLWAPVLGALNEAIFERGMRNVVVVGTPCTAQAIRRLRQSTNPRLKPYQDAIRLTLSVFCTGIYKQELIDDVLVRQAGLRKDQVKRLEVSPDREWLNAILWDGSVHTIPRTVAEQYTRPGCASCDDYLGESADLAVGTLNASEGASTLIVRSTAGEVFVRNAVQMNLLEASEQEDTSRLTEAAGEKDRRERAQAFTDLQVLMLDALADPFQRGEAIKLFTRLYRTPAKAGTSEKSRGGCTGC